jgi:hypothetical protein
MSCEEKPKVLPEPQQIPSESPGCKSTDSHQWDNKMEIQHLLSGKTDLEINESPEAAIYYEQAIACYNKGEYEKVCEIIEKAQSLGYQIPKKILKALRKASGTEK